MWHVQIAASIVLCLSVSLLAGCERFDPRVDRIDDPQSGHRFPLVAEISRIAVTQSRDYPDFDVPRQYWERLLDSLAHSQRNPQPPSRPILVELDIETLDGRCFHLLWFATDPRHDGTVGAFSVREASGTYTSFRGGDIGQFTKTLAEAHKQARAPKGRTKGGQN